MLISALARPVHALRILMSKLWFEESDKQVWHLMTERIGRGSFRAACCWTLSPVSGRIWPQKPGEDGPAEETQCRSCIGLERTGTPSA